MLCGNVGRCVCVGIRGPLSPVSHVVARKSGVNLPLAARDVAPQSSPERYKVQARDEKRLTKGYQTRLQLYCTTLQCICLVSARHALVRCVRVSSGRCAARNDPSKRAISVRGVEQRARPAQLSTVCTTSTSRASNQGQGPADHCLAPLPAAVHPLPHMRTAWEAVLPALFVRGVMRNSSSVHHEPAEGPCARCGRPPVRPPSLHCGLS